MVGIIVLLSARVGLQTTHYQSSPSLLLVGNKRLEDMRLRSLGVAFPGVAPGGQHQQNLTDHWRPPYRRLCRDNRLLHCLQMRIRDWMLGLPEMKAKHNVVFAISTLRPRVPQSLYLIRAGYILRLWGQSRGGSV